MLEQKSLLLLIKRYKNRHIDDRTFYQSLTEILTEEIGCSRASLWLYSDLLLNEIEAIDLYDRDKNIHSAGVRLYEESFQPYFAAMRSAGCIDAPDAREHPATRCFNERYFLPNDIYSLLDIGIVFNGQLVGVFCCEQVGEVMIWHAEQKAYLEQAGKLIAFALKPLLVHKFSELF